MKRSLSILFFSLFILTTVQALDVHSPQKAIDVAAKAIAAKLEMPLETIKNDYLISWEYEIFYEDDQSVVVQFSSLKNSSYCEVNLASESLEITETHCN